MGKARKVKTGVVISYREIYDLVQVISKSLHRVENKLENLEGKIEETVETEERSREALNKANEALEIAKETKAQIDWLWKATLSAFIVAIITALFYILGLPIGG